MISIDEILSLDQLVLRDHTNPDHRPINVETHRAALIAIHPKSVYAVVRRRGAVAAYGALSPQDDGTWFVGGIAIHPNHRNPAVFRDLAHQFSRLIDTHAMTTLKSNVFKRNAASVTLHRHLGFGVTRENEVGFEFTLTDLSALARYAKRVSP